MFGVDWVGELVAHALVAFFQLADQSHKAVHYEVQIQSFQSTFLTQDIDSTNGFERSRRQALSNIVDWKVWYDGYARGAVAASVTGIS